MIELPPEWLRQQGHFFFFFEYNKSVVVGLKSCKKVVPQIGSKRQVWSCSAVSTVCPTKITFATLIRLKCRNVKIRKQWTSFTTVITLPSAAVKLSHTRPAVTAHCCVHSCCFLCLIFYFSHQGGKEAYG